MDNFNNEINSIKKKDKIENRNRKQKLKYNLIVY